jgi:hypothetical protein
MSILNYEVYCETEAKFVAWFLPNTAAKPTKCPNSDAHTIDPTKTYLAPDAAENVDTELQTDSDGATLSRIKQAPTGWTYQTRGVEFALGTIGSLINKDYQNNNLTDAVMTIFNSSNVAVTDPTLALSTGVLTQIDWTPTYDYYLIGGMAQLQSPIGYDARISVVAVPGIPYNEGGSRPMIQALNMRYFADAQIVADGRASKGLLYNNPVAGTNTLRFSIYHPTMGSLSPAPATPIAIYLETYKQ